MAYLLRLALQYALIGLGFTWILAVDTARSDTHSPPALPDTLQYVVQPGDNLIGIASRHRGSTRHYALSDLVDDIRVANGLATDLLRPGCRLFIPTGCPEEYPIVADAVSAGADFRGIYLTGPACGVTSVFDRVDRFIAVGGNAVVFDAKDIDGGVTYASRHPLASCGAGRDAPVISRLDELIRRLRSRRVYVAARIACFLDGELGRQLPWLALVDSTDLVWQEKGQIWIDPTEPEVREYNIALAVELAQAGVDEIQFDYIRFPTNGWRGKSQRDRAEEAIYRREVISSFLKEARAALAPYRVEIAIDVYGVMAWGRVIDQAITGQHIPSLAECVDTICPMVYPSHYGRGFAGVDRPADHPTHFIAEGCRRFITMVAGSVRIRPWLQAFPYGTDHYDGQYILAQIEGGKEASAAGWCLWNPASSYTVAIGALAEAAAQDRVQVQIGAVSNDTIPLMLLTRNRPLYATRFHLPKRVGFEPQPAP